MPSFAGVMRSRLLTPSPAETNLEKRGFHLKSEEARTNLETVGKVFLSGFSLAVGSGSVGELERSLEEIPRDYRGFAYEGAGMGATVYDALPGHRGRLAGLLAGNGRRHVYMVYVGIGWAMARLPRFRWPDVRRTDPLLRWLILDGYGFHQAYFRTDRYVRNPGEPVRFSWAGGPDDASARVVDQGIGRALWFVGGACPDRVAALVEAFPAHRRPDLYAGTGLAATYAGSADESELRALVAHAGEHRYRLAQGAAFAAEARLLAGTEVPHTERATAVICGTTAAEAARLCTELRPAGPPLPGTTVYEEWRDGIASALASRIPPGKEDSA
ncbi:DUF1702 family protein [Streptomyces spiramenti]|uniref:DUF1702 family protein n=1 Tax=Streptomyces spiramenti TaxID=2720606 RepID=A0ABX1AJU4_9ACTN|nr:DUF1702 family protein [Streptomyces spiramenti]NJP65951.1 DUF1702 family protein [Streptomyces spiramenti]